MANEITRPSVNLLPMEDIEEALKSSFWHKIDDAAALETFVEDLLDTEPGIVAISTDGDRTTVRNAEELGNEPAENYLLKEKGLEINTESHKEIAALRSELYFMKNELIKRGFLDNTGLISGFADPFRQENILYDQQSLGSVSQSINAADMLLDVQDVENFKIGDFIVIRDETNLVVREIVDISASRVYLNNTVGYSMDSGSVELFKYSGHYTRGAYSFSKPGVAGPSSNEQFSTLDDESNKSSIILEDNILGFGYTFTVSDSLVDENYLGYLSKIQLKLKAVGTPGNITCYVLKFEDMDDFNHATNNNAIGTSAPVAPFGGATFTTVTFDFENSGTYPQIKARKENETKQIFCMVLVSSGIDSENYWEILTLEGVEPTPGGLHQNNVLYRYIYTGPASLETDNILDTEDFWYRVGIRSMVDREIIPHSEGLYTANFNIYDPFYASTAKVTMRINKEGQYKTLTSGELLSGTPLQYGPATTPFIFNPENKIVVGDKIFSITEPAVGQVKLTESTYLESSDLSAYPVNYKVFLLARNRYYDSDTNRYAYRDDTLIELPLKQVIPDFYKSNQETSDRLVFESSLKDPDDNIKLYNDFQLQIHWQSTASAGTIETDNSLVGQIFDLVVSFDNDTGGEI